MTVTVTGFIPVPTAPAKVSPNTYPSVLNNAESLLSLFKVIPY